MGFKLWLLQFLKIYFLFLCVSGRVSVCKHVHMCVSGCLRNSEEGVGSPWTGQLHAVVSGWAWVPGFELQSSLLNSKPS